MSARDDVVRWLTARLAEMLDSDSAVIGVDEPFSGFGLSSMRAVELSDDLQRWAGLELPPTLAYDYPTIGAVADFLVGQGGAAPVAAPVVGNAAVAVIGIGCRVPGASGPAEFWRLLCDGVDAIREVPTDRWSAAGWGGFLDDVTDFDADFFGVSAREAGRADPQQRIALEVACEALYDAGIGPRSLAGRATGVYVGAATFDHGAAVLGTPVGAEPYDGTGSALSIIANRISYCLDLRGPSMVVDTACSSSLVAVHLAARAVATGDVELAVAGGVNVITSGRIAQSFIAGGLMASDGRCKPFDDRADGYVRGEGAGMVVLKPLERALADGDRVYAVVLGGAVNQDGRTNGLTAPNRPAQEAVLTRAYRSAGIVPSTVDFVEAHGTGTAVGDPIEVGALATVLGPGRNRPLLIGSAKSNLGHLEAAAGVTGLIKTALALHHGQIPPTIHFRRANPLLRLDRVPIEVPDVVTPWPAGEALAGVSSFGFGGTNAHLVLSAAPAEVPEAPDFVTPVLIPLSARSSAALAERVQAWADLPMGDARWLGTVARAAALRADHDRHRAAVVVSEPSALAVALASADRRSPASEPLVGFVFPGQGSQWEGMGRELARAVPEFRDAIAECDERIRRWLGRSVWREDGLVIEGTAALQPALFAMQVAIARTWQSWGVRPAAVLGHSMGEIAAAHVAGALSLDDAVRVVCGRSRLLTELSGRGGLLLTELEHDEALELVSNREHEISVAAVNGPRAVVLAGTDAALDDMLARLSARGLFARRVAVEFAAHSPQVEPLVPRLRSAVEDIRPHAEAVPLYSTVTGGPIDGDELGPAYWARNLRQTVLFATALDRLVENGIDMVLEIAPHPVLLRSIAEAVRGTDAVALASMRRDDGELVGMLGGLGEFYTRGGTVDWPVVHGSDRTPHVDLPPHPWQHTTFPLVRSTAAVDAPTGKITGRGMPVGVAAGLTVWPLRLDGRVELADHLVADTAVVPATYELTAVAETIDSAVLIEDVVFSRPLAVEHAASAQLAMRGDAFTVTSQRAGETPVVHATGTVRAATSHEEAVTLRVPEDSAAALYERLSRAGLRYGPRFRGVRAVWTGDGEAITHVTAPVELDTDGWTLHPAVFDACLHTVAAAAQDLDGMPLPVGADRIWIGCEPYVGDLRCHARIISSGKEIVADIVVTDETAAVVWRCTGFRSRLVDAPARAEDGRLYEVAWTPLDNVRSTTRRWVVLGESPVAKALAERLSVTGAEQPDGVIDARGLDDGDMQETALSALRLIQSTEQGHVVLLTNGLAGAALWGLGRTLANEHPDRGCTVIDGGDADALHAVLTRAELPSQVRIRDGRALVPTLVPGIARADVPIRADREYVITGGLGVLGRRLARMLVERGARHLLLIGRGMPSEAAVDDLAWLRERCATVRIEHVDVADRAALAAALRTDGPRRAGVFHLAGVLRDGLIMDLDERSLREALAVKADGAWNLHELTCEDQLDHFVLFSSLAGVIGAPGQAAYAAGNTYLDALAEHRRAAGLAGLSVAWGPWADSGLAVTGGGVDRLTARGVPALPPGRGMALLEEALRTDGLIVAAALLPDVLADAVTGPAARQMLGVVATKRAAPSTAADALAAAGSTRDRRRVVMEFVAGQVAAVLRIEPARLETTVPFQDLGFDSLMAVELRDRLEVAFERRLSAALVYGHPTVAELGEELLRRLTPDADEDMGDELSTLDDDRIAELLAAELD
jgi:myxalamid-type polyketide synthase MxaD